MPDWYHQPDQVKMSALIIPYDQLSSEALHGVVEEFVTRDGTDYGEVEIPLETKNAQVLAQLKSGKAVIVFDQETESCIVLRSEEFNVLNLLFSIHIIGLLVVFFFKFRPPIIAYRWIVGIRHPYKFNLFFVNDSVFCTF